MASNIAIIPIFSVFLVFTSTKKKKYSQSSSNLYPNTQVKLPQSNEYLCSDKDLTFPGLLQL